MDGSQKLPQRLLGTVEDRLAQGGRIDALLLAIAGWIAYTANQSDDADLMAAKLRDCHTNVPRQTVRNVLSVSAIFKDTLSAQIIDPLSDVYTELTQKGAHNMLTALAHAMTLKETRT